MMMAKKRGSKERGGKRKGKSMGVSLAKGHTLSLTTP